MTCCKPYHNRCPCAFYGANPSRREKNIREEEKKRRRFLSMHLEEEGADIATF
jgi:hypothetical protein